MKYFTSGKLFWIDYKMPLFFKSNETFINEFDNEFYYKIIFIKEGQGVFNFSGKKVIGIAPLVLCLNEYENLEIIDKDDFTADSIYFQPDVINSFLTKENIYKKEDITFNNSTFQDFSIIQPFYDHEKSNISCINMGIVSANRLNYLFETFKKELIDQLSNESWPCRSRSYFLEILFFIDRIKNQALSVNDFLALEEENKNFQDIDKIIHYLHTNYMKKISIDEIARIFCTNRTSLYNFFNKKIGVPIISYLIKIRIDVACLILRNTELPIYEIMSRTGFNDITHFGRMFKKITNYSPTEYREKYYWMLHNTVS